MVLLGHTQRSRKWPWFVGIALLVVLSYWWYTSSKSSVDSSSKALSDGSPSSKPPFDTFEDFRTRVMSWKLKTDKFDYHDYLMLYHQYLSTLWNRRSSEPLRLLEIGLGCFMYQGMQEPTYVGQSVQFFNRALPGVKMTTIELQKECTAEWESKCKPTCPTHVINGDQTDKATLDAACRDRGPFDLIIDDGSHLSEHQLASLKVLWNCLKPGGFYVVEDIHGSCDSWDVPGTKNVVSGTKGCLKTASGAPTFFATIVQEWLPILAANARIYPEGLPGLEGVDFRHESVIFTKRLPE